MRNEWLPLDAYKQQSLDRIKGDILDSILGEWDQWVDEKNQQQTREQQVHEARLQDWLWLRGLEEWEQEWDEWWEQYQQNKHQDE